MKADTIYVGPPIPHREFDRQAELTLYIPFGQSSSDHRNGSIEPTQTDEWDRPTHFWYNMLKADWENSVGRTAFLRDNGLQYLKIGTFHLVDNEVVIPKTLKITQTRKKQRS